MNSREKLVMVPVKKRDSAREKEKDRQNGEKRITCERYRNGVKV